MKIFRTIKPYLLLIVFSVGLLSCGTSKTENTTHKLTAKTPFTIEKPYSQKWVSGVKRGGSGINLFVHIKNISEEVSIKNLYFRNKITKAEKSHNNKDLFIGYYKNDGSRDVIMDIDITKEAANTPKEEFPFQLQDNQAVISYLQSGKTWYFKILNIEQKQLLAYPQSNSKIKD